MTAPTDQSRVTQERIADAIAATEYKYFGDYEMTPEQRAAVDILVLAAREHLAPASEMREMAARASDEELDPYLPETVRGAKRCGIQRFEWLHGWYVGWSPRNENENAEGNWSDWVALARAILAADEQARCALPSQPTGDAS